MRFSNYKEEAMSAWYALMYMVLRLSVVSISWLVNLRRDTKLTLWLVNPRGDTKLTPWLVNPRRDTKLTTVAR